MDVWMSNGNSIVNLPVEPEATEILELTIVANEMAMNDRQVNAYAVRNAQLLERRKNRIRYLNGYTELPASAERLLSNAEDLTYNHRRTLARNISKSEQRARPVASCAHHIVALSDKEALRSRLRLFGWGIAINDADNGVFLPRDAVGLPNYPNAARHTPYHRVRYHLQVWMRLQRATGQGDGRVQLRAMKTDLLAGKMTL